jgi:hypothetical protein
MSGIPLDEALEVLAASAKLRQKRKPATAKVSEMASAPAPKETPDVLDIVGRYKKIKTFHETPKGMFAAVFSSITRMPSDRMFANPLSFNIPAQSANLQYVSRERSTERSLENDDDSQDTKTKEDIEDEISEFNDNDNVQRKVRDRVVQLRSDDASKILRSLRDQTLPHMVDPDNVVFSADVQGSIIRATNELQRWAFQSMDLSNAINARGYVNVIFNSQNTASFITEFAQLAAFYYIQQLHLSPMIRTFKDRPKELDIKIAGAISQIRNSFDFVRGIFVENELVKIEEESMPSLF